MTNVKRLFAVLLSIVMILTSASVAAFADNEPNTLKIRTEFGKYVNGTWTEVTEVAADTDITARIYVDTDFESLSAQMVYFYDADFFSTSYSAGAALRTGSAYDYDCLVWTEANSNFGKQLFVKTNQITQEQADDYGFVYITATKVGNDAECYSDDDYLCEVDFHVLASASGIGNLFVIPGTIASTSNQVGRFSVNRRRGTTDTFDEMWLWDADFDVPSAKDSVAIIDNAVLVTLDANGGSFTGGADTTDIVGSAGSEIESLPAPTRAGYTLAGWSLYDDATTGSALTNFPDADATYYAVWTASENAGNNLVITTKFFRQVDGEWVETTRVKRGEQVKARVYVATDYFANSGELLFFYDNDFFENGYSNDINDLSVNDNVNSVAADKGIIGWFYTADSDSLVKQNLVNRGYITQDFADQNDFYHVSYRFDQNDRTNAILYDDKDFGVDEVVDNDLWLCEFDMTVSESATGWGDLKAEEETVIDPSDHYYAVINVPRGVADSEESYAMWLWVADAKIYSNPVTLYSTVTFDANGGEYSDGETEYIISGDIGDAINTAAVPVPEWDGHIFLGWYDAEDPDETIVSVPAEIPYEDVTLLAKWSNEVTVSFETYGGTAIEAVTGPAGEAFDAVIEDPVKTGYNFIGWSQTAGTVSGLNPVTGLPTVFPDDDITYYAVWNEEVYTAKYYVLTPDGNAALVATLPLSVDSELALDISSVYTAPKGYNVNGWYYTVTCTDLVPADATMPAKDLELFAKLTYADVIATFDANGGEFSDGTDVKTVDATYMGNVEAPEDPTKEGFTFKGWEPEVGIMIDPEGMTFKATWDETPYTESFYVDGELYQDYSNMFFGNPFEVPADPSKEGYEFKGWAEEEDSDTVAALPATMPAKDTEYYAVFEIKTYTITYDLLDGTLTVGTDSYTGEYTADYEYAADIADVDDPTAGNDYYEFVEWKWYDVDEDGNQTEAEAPAAMPANDMIAEAVYAPKTYVAEFNANGGTFADGTDVYTEDVVYNEAITGPADPTAPEGYEFTGWTPDFETGDKMLPASGDDDGITYVATYKALEYTITYDPNGGELKKDGLGYSSDAPYTENVACDETVTVITEEPTKDGYVFGGWEWDTEDGAAPATMPAGDVKAAAVWNPALDTEYVINYFEMDTNGDYPTDPTRVDSRTGKTENTVQVLVNATDATSEANVTIIVSAPEGFTFDAANTDNVLEGTIAPDGSLELAVYFTRNQYNVTFDPNGGYFNGDTADTAPVTTLEYYGAALVAPTAEKEGNDFNGWEPSVPATVPAEDTEYVAQWTPHSGSITFDAGEGTFPGKTDDPATTDVDESKTDVVEGDFGDPVEAPEDPVREGYTFDGWEYTDENGDSVDEPTTIPDGKVKAEPKWTANPGSVVFDAGEGTFPGKTDDPDTADIDESKTAPVEGVYGDPVVLPDDPEREGYDFDGWEFTDEDGNPVDEPTTIPDGTINAEPKWTPKKYDVVFDANTGKIAGQDSKTISMDYDSDIIAPVEEMTKSGYSFRGWAFTADATEPATDYGKVPVDGTTLYAVWAPNSGVGYWLYIYKMGLDGKYPAATTPTDKVQFTDGVVGEYRNLTYTAGDGFYLDDSDSDGTVEYSVLTGMIPANGSLILTAYLARDRYELTAISEGDTFAGPTEYYYGASVADPGVPAKAGYEFVGWADEADASDANVTFPFAMPAEDVTVYAVFALADYTVSFNAGEGSFPDAVDDPATPDVDESKVYTDEVAYGDDIAAPTDDPEREGYDFGGWADPADPTTPVDDFGTMGDDDVEYIAIWNAKTYTITYKVATRDADESSSGYGKLSASDTVFEDYTVTCGDAFVEPTADPEILYYNFKGWALTDSQDPATVIDEFPATMPAGDLVYYAVFERQPVYLIAKEGSTTVIDRGVGYYGGKDSAGQPYYEVGTVNRVTTQEYSDYDPASGNVWYVYGLCDRIPETILRSEYCDVYGDGYFTVEPVAIPEVSTIEIPLGTSAKISVYDRVTGDLVETFEMVVFGDLSGDAGIRATDTSVLNAEVQWLTAWSDAFDGNTEFDSAMFMAGDIYRDQVITSDDSSIEKELVAWVSDIDQVTGEVIHY